MGECERENGRETERTEEEQSSRHTRGAHLLHVLHLCLQALHLGRGGRALVALRTKRFGVRERDGLRVDQLTTQRLQREKGRARE